VPSTPARRPSPPPPRPTPSRPAPAPGGMGGLLIVGGIGFVLLLVMLAAAGWYFFGRSVETPTADAAPTAAPPALTAAPPTPAAATAEPATPVPTEADTTSTVATGATLPPATSRTPAVADAATKPPSTTVADAGPRSSGAEEYAYLDDEGSAPTDGVEAGDRLSRAYGNDRGSRMGSSSRLKRRPKSPEGLRLPAERAAVATMRHLIYAELAFHRREGRYGSLADLVNARLARLDVKPSAKGFDRNGYRFDLRLKEDGFDVTAMPQAAGLRPFHGDDSEYITVGLD
jgi:hypothetical protein